jgi:hypothetical protein
VSVKGHVAHALPGLCSPAHTPGGGGPEEEDQGGQRGGMASMEREEGGSNPPRTNDLTVGGLRGGAFGIAASSSAV